MPGLNQKGPMGEGAMTGRRSGMCRRTGDVPFQQGSGRGMGRRIRTSQTMPQREPGKKGGLGQMVEETDVSAELAELKKQYKAKSEELERLVAKIKSLEV